MHHCKVMIVDGLWTSVGSTNFDSRFFSVNDEANLNVLNAFFAEAQRAAFDADLRLPRRVTLEDWECRGWLHKLLDALASTYFAVVSRVRASGISVRKCLRTQMHLAHKVGWNQGLKSIFVPD
jgi:phosphatidylserine/phosphatidylglycerophosphate/cardiolipin synthase-like enzyme